jgi:hypothetical protein
MHKKFQYENVMGTDYLENLGLYGRIILKWNLEKQVENWAQVILE